MFSNSCGVLLLNLMRKKGFNKGCDVILGFIVKCQDYSPPPPPPKKKGKKERNDDVEEHWRDRNLYLELETNF